MDKYKIVLRQECLIGFNELTHYSWENSIGNCISTAKELLQSENCDSYKIYQCIEHFDGIDENGFEFIWFDYKLVHESKQFRFA